MKVPQMLPWIGAEEAAGVVQSIDDNWITEGPKSAQFVQQLNELMGAKYSVLAPNGTLALYLGLVAMGVEAGDEVIVPDSTFIASANAVVMAGATPVFVDVNSDNFQINLADADDLVNERTKAVMPVHLYGMAADMDAVAAFATRHNLMIIEDAAQGIGVHYRDKHVGAFGDVGCFSFFADKTITTGEGGLVVCRDEQTYERLQLLRNQGRINRGTFVHDAIGFNFRMTDLQTAIGLAQLDRLNTIIQRKRTILSWYHEELDGVDQVHFTKLQPHSSYVPFRAVLVCEAAHKLMVFMEQREIQSRTSFYPLHKQPCFQQFADRVDLSDERYPNAIMSYDNGILLPCFPQLSREQVKHIGNTIREFYTHGWNRTTITITTRSTQPKTTAAK